VGSAAHISQQHLELLVRVHEPRAVHVAEVEALAHHPDVGDLESEVDAQHLVLHVGGEGGRQGVPDAVLLAHARQERVLKIVLVDSSRAQAPCHGFLPVVPLEVRNLGRRRLLRRGLNVDRPLRQAARVQRQPRLVPPDPEQAEELLEGKLAGSVAVHPGEELHELVEVGLVVQSVPHHGLLCQPAQLHDAEGTALVLVEVGPEQAKVLILVVIKSRVSPKMLEFDFPEIPHEIAELLERDNGTVDFLGRDHHLLQLMPRHLEASADDVHKGLLQIQFGDGSGTRRIMARKTIAVNGVIVCLD
jgi:hypothetical protein